MTKIRVKLALGLLGFGLVAALPASGQTYSVVPGGDAQYAQAEARQLEDHPLATAPFDPAGRGSGGAQSYGRDTPPAAIRQPAADPAAVLNERRAPLSQGEVEIQLSIRLLRVGDTAEQTGGAGVGHHRGAEHHGGRGR